MPGPTSRISDFFGLEYGPSTDILKFSRRFENAARLRAADVFLCILVSPVSLRERVKVEHKVK